MTELIQQSSKQLTEKHRLGHGCRKVSNSPDTPQSSAKSITTNGRSTALVRAPGEPELSDWA